MAASLGIGELCRLGDDGGQDGLKIDRRIHRLADFAERAQLADRLGEFARACLHFVEQPNILDCDYRLIGEGLHKSDLLVRERFELQSVEGDSSNQAIAFQHWDRERRPDGPLVSYGIGIFRIGLDVRDVHRSPLERSSC